jgi:hypothetical protein
MLFVCLFGGKNNYIIIIIENISDNFLGKVDARDEFKIFRQF